MDKEFILVIQQLNLILLGIQQFWERKFSRKDWAFYKKNVNNDKMKEIIITVGPPAAGKSTLVKKYIDRGYVNFNRDDNDTSVSQLHQRVKSMVSALPKIILDNTYLTLAHRKEIVDIAKSSGHAVKVLWLQTTIEQCQFNACYRIAMGGREVPASALFAAKKMFVEPKLSEGFASIEKIPFTRSLPSEYKNKALILDYDGTVRVHRDGGKFPTLIEHIQIIPGIVQKLQEYKSKGYLLLGASNQSSVGKGDISAEQMDELFKHTNKLLGFDIDVLYCPDASFPIKSYDRKPLPGMGVKHIVKYKLNPAETIMVGDSTSDKTFASRSGFQFIHIDQFK